MSKYMQKIYRITPAQNLKVIKKAKKEKCSEAEIIRRLIETL